MNQLDIENIPYTYFEMISFEKINKLYNLLDLYIVSSRYEGGPQSILECALIKTPIISTDVGIASEILSAQSIFEMNNFQNVAPQTEYAFNKVQKYKIPKGFIEFNEVFRKLSE